MDTIEYVGCFFDPEALQKRMAEFAYKRLHRTIKAPHVTFSYRPSYIPWESFGEEIAVAVIGYGNDGENEALQVAFTQLPDRLKDLASQIPVPHITLSVAKNGKPVNSGNLSFTPITPFVLTGIFGGMDEQGNVHTSC